MSAQVYEKYPLYLKVTALTFTIMTVIIGVFMYLLWPGLFQFGMIVALSGEILLALFPALSWFLLVVLMLATMGVWKVSPILLRISNRFIYTFFSISAGLAKLGGISKDRFSQAMIDMINHLVSLHLYKVDPERILLLTPHCLQEQSCVHKVTHDVYNCKQCGRCQVGDLLQVTKDYGCQFVVVTGGTLARMQVKSAKPKAIVAIACERDLASGMADVFPIPVIGVLNERPNGPCCNTKVDTTRIREVIEGLIDERRNGNSK